MFNTHVSDVFKAVTMEMIFRFDKVSLLDWFRDRDLECIGLSIFLFMDQNDADVKLKHFD